MTSVIDDVTSCYDSYEPAANHFTAQSCSSSTAASEKTRISDVTANEMTRTSDVTVKSVMVAHASQRHYDTVAVMPPRCDAALDDSDDTFLVSIMESDTSLQSEIDDVMSKYLQRHDGNYASTVSQPVQKCLDEISCYNIAPTSICASDVDEFIANHLLPPPPSPSLPPSSLFSIHPSPPPHSFSTLPSASSFSSSLLLVPASTAQVAPQSLLFLSDCADMKKDVCGDYHLPPPPPLFDDFTVDKGTLLTDMPLMGVARGGDGVITSDVYGLTSTDDSLVTSTQVRCASSRAYDDVIGRTDVKSIAAALVIR